MYIRVPRMIQISLGKRFAGFHRLIDGSPGGQMRSVLSFVSLIRWHAPARTMMMHAIAPLREYVYTKALRIRCDEWIHRVTRNISLGVKQGIRTGVVITHRGGQKEGRVVSPSKAVCIVVHFKRKPLSECSTCSSGVNSSLGQSLGINRPASLGISASCTSRKKIPQLLAK